MMGLVAALLLAAPLVAEPPPSPSLKPDFLILSLGPELGTRRVTYRDRVSPGLAGYQSGAIGLLRLAAEVYPVSGKGLPLISDIGFTGSTSRSLRAQAQFSPGTSFDDQWHLWDVGVRWRAIFAGEEWGALSIQYGSVSSVISGPRLYGVLLPGGTLQYWRPGLELRLPLGPLALSLSGGYLAGVVQDSIGHAFPRASQGGVDAGASLSFSFHRNMAARLSGRYLRFFYSLHPQPGDPFVAGGALDEYALAELAFVLRV